MSDDLQADVLRRLAALVACDTRNPPRRITAEALYVPLLPELQAAGFTCEISDHGGGAVTLFARRGAPRLLFNCHLDTVPDAPGWSGDPHTLKVDGARATGLGACDTKGAAACLLAAAARTRGPAALLFTTDEEAGAGTCVPAFLAGLPERAYDGVIVAEPTGCQAVCGHRGIATSSGCFSGVAGHASQARALVDSALHEAVRWASAALRFAEDEEQAEVGGMRGVRFNLGTLHGGHKANMIADAAEARFGVRPRPGEDPAQLVRRVQALAPDPARATWHAGFLGPPLPAPGRMPAHELAAALRLAAAPPVDFWSEASLFSAAGLPALVFGPGQVQQAHAPDEWVALDQLAAAAHTYLRLLA